MLLNRLHNYWRIIRKLTPARAFNLVLLRGSYLLSKLSGRVIHAGMPFSVSIEPTTSCNLRCPQCPSGLRAFTRPTGMLSHETFGKVVDAIAGKLHSLTLYFQGEPFLNPRLTEMISYASSKRLYTTTSTNGHYLNEENAATIVSSGLDKLIISIDGVTQESYAAYRRGGNLQKVVDGVSAVVSARRKARARHPYIVVQFVVFSSNEHEIDGARKLGRSLGADEVTIKTAQIYDFENGDQLMPTDPRFARYAVAADGRYSIKSSLHNECWRMWRGCVVTWDGTVVPCCFDKDASHPLGSVMNTEFEALWRSEAYTAFRASVLASRADIDICRNCSEGVKVWA